jgi:hypothetical protein
MLDPFVAHGRILCRSEQTYGDDDNPMAEVGVIHLLAQPVVLKKAERSLGPPWINAPQGIATRR